MGVYPETVTLNIYCKSKANGYLWGDNLGSQNKARQNTNGVSQTLKTGICVCISLEQLRYAQRYT